jgi:hypothetical protein
MTDITRATEDSQPDSPEPDSSTKALRPLPVWLVTLNALHSIEWRFERECLDSTSADCYYSLRCTQCGAVLNTSFWHPDYSNWSVPDEYIEAYENMRKRHEHHAHKKSNT